MTEAPRGGAPLPRAGIGLGAGASLVECEEWGDERGPSEGLTSRRGDSEQSGGSRRRERGGRDGKAVIVQVLEEIRGGDCTKATVLGSWVDASTSGSSMLLRELASSSEEKLEERRGVSMLSEAELTDEKRDETSTTATAVEGR